MHAFWQYLCFCFAKFIKIWIALQWNPFSKIKSKLTNYFLSTQSQNVKQWMVQEIALQCMSSVLFGFGCLYCFSICMVCKQINDSCFPLLSFILCYVYKLLSTFLMSQAKTMLMISIFSNYQLLEKLKYAWSILIQHWKVILIENKLQHPQPYLKCFNWCPLE